jgi:sugar phosphate isomerase/epimerase
MQFSPLPAQAKVDLRPNIVGCYRSVKSVSRKWSKQVKPEPNPLRPLFEEVAAEGYDMMEWRSPTSHGVTVPEMDLMADARSAEEIRRLSEEFDLELAYHAPQGPLWEFGTLPFRVAVSQLRECIRRSLSINASIMTFHLGIADDEQRFETVKQGARAIDAVSSYAEDSNVWLCVENVFEFDRCSVANAEEFETLFETAKSPRLRFTLDTGHANLYGVLYELVERFPDKLFFTHLHDNNGFRDQHLVPGHGVIDWRRLLTCLDSAAYRGALNFELREECTLPELIHIFSSYADQSE